MRTDVETPVLDEFLQEAVGFYPRKESKLGPGVAEAFDPTTIITMLREIFSILSSMCSGGTFWEPPPRPDEVAAGMIQAVVNDDRRLLFQLWKVCERGAARTINRNDNPLGRRLRGGELHDLRHDAAIRAYYTFIDGATSVDRVKLAGAIEDARLL